MVSALTYYDPTYDKWPDLRLGRIVLAPVRVGMNRRTGKIMVGWDHVVQSMEMIFATRFHERVLRRWVGSFVPHLLGESAIDRTITRFYWAIMVSLELWEPNYRLYRVLVKTRDDGSSLTSPEELRLGHVTFENQGVYLPRAHLGDPTPEARQRFGLVGMGAGSWEVHPI